MEELSGFYHPAVLAGVIGVIVQLFKAWDIPSRYYFLISVILGLAFYITIYIIEEVPWNIVEVVLNGLVAGGTASGIYSGVSKAGVRIPQPKRRK